MKMKRSESIRRHMLGPLLVLLILQAVVIAGLILFGGVSIKLKNNEIHILSENTENTRLNLEKETIHQWFGILNNSDVLAVDVQNVLDKHNRLPEDIKTDYALNGIIADEILEKSIDMLHRSYATGVFFVLNGPAARNSPEGTKAGFYVRNSNAGGYEKDYSSLLLERGLPSMAEKYHIPLDSFWELGFLEGGNNDFYKKPFESAVENQAQRREAMNYAYLSPPFRLSPKDMPVITYSVPVILEDGTVAGVFGLEMSLNRIEEFLGEDRTKSSFLECWLLGIGRTGEKSIMPVADSGYLYNQYFNGDEKIDYQDNPSGNISELISSDGTKWYASIKKLEVYENNSPFEQDEWLLVGLAKQKDLLSFYNAIRKMLLGSMAVPLVFSLLGAFVMGKIVTDPIRGLVRELRDKSGARELNLKRVRISEIDELTETIEQLSRDVERSASKISTILEHANVLVGVFECEEGTGQVFCSRSLFELLGWSRISEPYCYISTDQFHELMKKTFGEGSFKGNYYVQPIEDGGEKRWVGLTLDISNNGVVLGVCSDVTAEVLEKKKLEKERNYDLLTDLYNRRAFREQIELVLKDRRNGIAAVIMWDLDNLKFINDTYGHDEGDRYIVLFADCLKTLTSQGAVVGRYSGDEFVTVLWGSDKEKIRDRVRDFKSYIQSTTLKMDGGYQFPIRVSGGLSWYPEQAGDFGTLLNYADFAMYMVKHSVKGILKEFDFSEYSHNSYMLAGREELNLMLEEKKVRFAFQPIVTREGQLYGYELLMRPEFKNLKGISEVLNLARAQAKMPQMEMLTWFAGLEAAQNQYEAGLLGDYEKLFINSIASVCLSEESRQNLETRYKGFLHRIVIEMTEGEPMNQDYMQRKLAMARSWKGMIAVDDYGTGYNGDAALLHMKPDIVKVDRSIVQNIDKDRNRQMILKSLLDFAGQNRIMVLAEGVETAEELEYLINSQVFLFQGYYIARPQLEIRPVDPYIVKKIKEFAGKS